MVDYFSKIPAAKIKTILLAWENNDYLLNKLEIPKPELLSTPHEAAVLIPLYFYNGIWNLLFTRRNQGLNDHSGQVSFPGGRSDPDDKDKKATALRETFEEIGVAYKDVDVLGKLPDILTITNFNITPVVGVIPWPYPLKIAEHEVSRVFSIPLQWLANKKNFVIKEKYYPGKAESVSVIYYHEYEGEILWGVTARIVTTFIAILSMEYNHK